MGFEGGSPVWVGVWGHGWVGLKWVGVNLLFAPLDHPPRPSPPSGPSSHVIIADLQRSEQRCLQVCTNLNFNR